MHTSLRAIAGVVLAAALASAAPLPASVTLKRDYLRKNLSLRGGQGPSLTRSVSQQDMSKPNVKRLGPQAATEVSKKIWSLSSQYKPADKTSIQKYVDVPRPVSSLRCCKRPRACQRVLGQCAQPAGRLALLALPAQCAQVHVLQIVVRGAAAPDPQQSFSLAMVDWPCVAFAHPQRPT